MPLRPIRSLAHITAFPMIVRNPSPAPLRRRDAIEVYHDVFGEGAPPALRTHSVIRGAAQVLAGDEVRIPAPASVEGACARVSPTVYIGERGLAMEELTWSVPVSAWTVDRTEQDVPAPGGAYGEAAAARGSRAPRAPRPEVGQRNDVYRVGGRSVAEEVECRASSFTRAGVGLQWRDGSRDAATQAADGARDAGGRRAVALWSENCAHARAGQGTTRWDPPCARRARSPLCPEEADDST